MPVNSHIDALIIKHLQDTITEDEKNILNEWIAADDNHRAMFDRLTNDELLHQDLVAYGESDQRIKEQVYAQLPEVQDALTVVPKRRWMRYASLAAAVVIGIAIVSIWYWRPEKTNESNDGTPAQTQVATVIPAGGNKATLTLADGTVIDLDKQADGTIAEQGKTTVKKKENGQLEYQLATGNKQHEIIYNMLSTPRGGQYQLLLPDGSKVWLNAASSIRYPTAFAGNERRVEVSGELYFEITKDNKPFKVTIIPADGGGRGGEVEVLGTHFNINAYGDEQAIVTTLLEGKIKISTVELVSKQSADIKNHKPQTSNHKLLLPGEEAQISKNAAIVVRKNVDTEASVAWMKGFFDFHNAGIKSVMKQVSRWYNVDVQYAGAVPAQTFEGSLDRNIPLNELLALLNQMGKTNFTIDGRTVKVQ